MPRVLTGDRTGLAVSAGRRLERPARRLRPMCSETHETPPIMKSVKNSCGVFDLAIVYKVFLRNGGNRGEVSDTLSLATAAVCARAVGAGVDRLRVQVAARVGWQGVLTRGR